MDHKKPINQHYMRAPELAELLGVSKSKAYKIIAQLNKELEAQGKITVAGRISSRYAKERLYC
ncbi:MAG: transcriptional regulator [Ruminococcus sp.]